MEIKDPKEHPTAYKVRRVELISEKSCFVMPIQDRAGKIAASFLEFFKHFPELYGKSTELHQANYWLNTELVIQRFCRNT